MSSFFAALIACAYMAAAFVLFGVLPGWWRKHRPGAHALPDVHGHFASAAERHQP